MADPYDAAAGRFEAGDEPEPMSDVGDERAGAGRGIGEHLAELLDYGGFYLRTRVDSVKLRARNVAVYAALALVGFVVLAAILTVAIVLAFRGIAAGLAIALGDRAWAGDLLTGVLMLSIVGGGGSVALARMRASMKRKRIKDYEDRRALQRSRYGRDIAQVAAEGNGSRVRAEAGR